eukprot:jgi/Psemu1/298110/fgenesh1_pm.474_\
MRVSNFDSRLPGSVSCVKNPCRLEVQTAIRIRPKMKKERDDLTLLETQKQSDEAAGQIVILNPLHPSLAQSTAETSIRGRSDSDSTIYNVPTEYHFNNVFDETTTQDKMFNTLGLSVVHASMKSLKNTNSNRTPNSHLFVSMGIENSGKTYTCFGGMTISKRRGSDDGLVPRLIDSFFSQSAHAGAKEFTVQISFVQVTESQVYDLLAKQSNSSKTKKFGMSPMKNLNVRNMAARFELVVPSPVGRKTQKTSEDAVVLDAENLMPTVQSCRDATHAREVLQNGLSASQKQATGNQKCHFYITIQPVIDGTKFGDRISVLDMAGLEKEDTLHNARENESIASKMNQTALTNNAVLNCLQLLTHNSKIIAGNGNNPNGSTDYDDDYSEVSSVSRAKFPRNEQLKPVPFRHNKVTMVLNPIFERSSFVKVTLLLSAYPGHADFLRKRNLLNDLELLHGSTLVVSQDASKINHTVKCKSRSSPVNRNAQHTTYENNRGVNSSAPLEQVGSKFQPSFQPKGRKVTPSAPVMAKVVAVRSSRRHRPSVKSSAPIIPGAEPVKMSKNNDSEGKITLRTPARKSEDLDSLEKYTSVHHLLEQVTPSLSEVQQYCMESKEIRETVTDFPGVEFSRTSGRESERKHYTTPTKSRRTYRNGKESSSKEYKNCSAPKSSIERGAEARKNFEMNGEQELKPPLGRSRLENSECHMPVRTRKMQDDAQRTKSIENAENISHSEDALSICFETNFLDFENKINIEKEDTTENLEATLKEAIEEKKTLEQICSQLERENAELKSAAREAGRKALQSRWTDQDEEEFLASRKLRHEAQHRIKYEIREHLERVNYIYEIKNQCFMTNKRHFSLKFPDQFQRAPILDIRDKNNENEETENYSFAKKETCLNDEDAVKNTGLASGKTSLTTSRLTPPKRVPAPAGLSALRKLTGKA